MKEITKERLLCSECHKPFDVDVYYVMNVTSNPELRKQFINDELFFYKCPHCGHINFAPYEFIYCDEEHHFIVIYGDIDYIYDLTHEHKDYLKKCLTKSSLEEMTITGATNIFLAREKIMALENDLDHKAATTARYLMFVHHNELEEKDGKPVSNESFLDYDEQGALVVVYGYRNEKESYALAQTFPLSFYEIVKKNLKLRLINSCDWLFNEDTAFNVIMTDEKAMKKNLKIKAPIALVKNTENEFEFVKFFPLDKLDYEIGDTVIFLGENKFTYKGKLLKIITDMSIYNMPFVYDDAPTMLKTIDDASLTTSKGSTSPIDNDEFIDALLKFNNRETPFPTDIAIKSNVIVALQSYYDGNINIVDEDGNILDEGLNNAKVGDYLKGNFKMEPVIYSKDGSPLLCIYLNHEDVPESDDGLGVSKAICNFDDVINYVIQMPEKYDGIDIVIDDKDITLSTSFIMRTYIPNRILANNQKMIELLKSLTQEEKEYMGLRSYEYISTIYLQGKTHRQIAEEKNINLNVIGRYLNQGYKRLVEIVIFRK